MKIKVGVLSFILLAVCGTGYALGTTETFDTGFSDVEVNFGYAGLDSSSCASTVFSEMLLGIGVTESFSTSVCFSAEPGFNLFFTAGVPGIGNVELLTAVDLEHSDNEGGDNEFDYSSVSFGIKFPATESIELISQFDLIDAGDDETIKGISFGFVAGI